VHRALVFAFEDRDALRPSRGKDRADARTCDAAADDQNVEIAHLLHGYELESLTV
jgi:hypothetical protein